MLDETVDQVLFKVQINLSGRSSEWEKRPTNWTFVGNDEALTNWKVKWSIEEA